MPDDNFYPCFILTNLIEESNIDGHCAFQGQDIEICLKPKPFIIDMKSSIKRLFIKLGDNAITEETQTTELKDSPFNFLVKFDAKYYTQDELTNFFNTINTKLILLPSI